MTNEQIIKKAIEKAVKNGFNHSAYYIDGYFDVWLNEGDGKYRQEYTIIFSHNFAKAFWGEEIYQCSGDFYHLSSCGGCNVLEDGWQYHLQHMVLEKAPLRYLEKFL